MAAVNLTILGKPYAISCDDGQEQHLREMAAFLDRKIKSLHGLGPATESTLLVITALTLIDELSDARRDVAMLKEEVERARQRFDAQRIEDAKVAVDQALNSVAERMEAIAEALESM